MTRLVRGLRAVDQSDGSTVAWTRANIGEVLPGVVTPLTWSVFLANLLRRPLSKVEAESSPNGPIRLGKGGAPTSGKTGSWGRRERPEVPLSIKQKKKKRHQTCASEIQTDSDLL